MNFQYRFSEPLLTNKIYNSKKKREKINFSNLLVEITKRTLNEDKSESNLFFH